jgi:hypothetical protein
LLLLFHSFNSDVSLVHHTLLSRSIATHVLFFQLHCSAEVVRSTWTFLPASWHFRSNSFTLDPPSRFLTLHEKLIRAALSLRLRRTSAGCHLRCTFLPVSSRNLTAVRTPNVNPMMPWQYVPSFQDPSSFPSAPNVNSRMPWQSVPSFQGPSSFFGTSNVNPTMPWPSGLSPHDTFNFTDESKLDSTLPMWQPRPSPHDPSALVDESNPTSTQPLQQPTGTRRETAEAPLDPGSEEEQPEKRKKRASLAPGYVSGAELQQSTAGDLIGEDPNRHHLAFHVSSPRMSGETTPDETIRDLWSHCSGKRHRRGIFAKGQILCELGCQVGFADPAHRLLQYLDLKSTNQQVPTRLHMASRTQNDCRPHSRQHPHSLHQSPRP